jgi:Spy/CpxP family protein refolding chaperone
MRKIKSSVMPILIFSFLLVGKTLYAQGPPGPPFPEEGKRERLKEEIETMKMWKMIEALNLSQEQSDRFLPAWRELQKAQKTFREKRENLFRILEISLGEEKPKAGKIKDILIQLEKERIFLEEVQQRFREKAKEILTLEQQAKLLLFEDSFEKKMMDIIRQYRGKRSFGK